MTIDFPHLPHFNPPMQAVNGCRLVLIPGIGVDEGLFAPQREALGPIESPPWIEPHERESLRSYAHRLADLIGPAGPLVLGGQSFGGMLALEAARVLRPRAVVLIASCTSAKSVPRPYWLLETLSHLMPDRMARAIFRAQASRIAWKLDCGDEACRQFLAQRFSEASITFVRWAVRAIREWSFENDLTMPIHHIHGDRDRIMPIGRVNPTQIIPGAGHLLTMTHPAQVNAFIAEVLRNGG